MTLIITVKQSLLYWRLCCEAYACHQMTSLMTSEIGRFIRRRKWIGAEGYAE